MSTYQLKNRKTKVFKAIAGMTLMTLASNSQAAELEEIVVTATKRSESLQTVPLSVAAISGASIERSGIQDFEDIAKSVPSLSFKSAGPGRTKLNIRGISASTGFSPTVAYYIDEQPIASISSGSTSSFAQTIVSPKLFDLERIEVLRGPQGTIYGSSAQGGTVRLITGQPTIGETYAKVAGELSDTDEGGTNFTLNGLANLSLGDSAALRIVASTTDNDGFIDRFVNGQLVDDNVNTEETTSVRAALRFQINDSSYIQPAIFSQKTEQDGKPNFDATPGNSGSLRQNRDFDLAETFEDEFTLSSIVYNKDFDNMNLLVNVSNIDREVTNVENVSQPLSVALGLPIFEANAADELVELDDTTYEVRLSSTSSSNLQWVAGLYRKEVEIDAGYRLVRGTQPTLNAIGAGVFDGIANVQDTREFEESAIFGEINWTFSDQWDLTFGLRYLETEFSQSQINYGLAFGTPTESLAVPVASSIEDDTVNYRVTLAYQYDDASQVYLTTSDATRPGGGNRTLPRSTDPVNTVGFACNNDLNELGITSGSVPTFDSDTVTNLELGWKSDITDALRVNAAIYRIEWDDVQQLVNTSSVCGNNFTSNLGEAESTGLELEVTAALTEQFTLTAGLGLTEAEFTNTVSLGGSNIITAGDRLADVPETTFSLSGDYIWPTAKGEIFALASINYVDEVLERAGQVDTNVSVSGIVQGNVRPSYTLVDARIGYTSASNWEIALFADNLTNEEAFFSFQDVIAVPTGTFDRTVRNRPRTIGVSFKYDF